MFNNVLLTIDLAHKDAQEPALKAAKKFAAEGSNIYVVSVIPPLEGGGFVQSFLPANYDKELTEKGKTALREFTKTHLSEVSNIKHLVVYGKVYEKITDAAEQLDIDLIITMASIRKSNTFGPNVARVVRNSGCSVLILR